MFFLHSKNVGKEEFRVHKELNLRHSDLFSDEPQRLYREKVWGSHPPVDSDCILCPTFLDKTENTIFFLLPAHPFMYLPTLFVKHVSQTLSSFFSLYQELRFFLSQVWQEQIYKDNKKKVGAILNKIGSHWFFSMPSNLASPEKVLPSNVTISVAKISMCWPSIFFLFSTIYTVFFKLLPQQKGKRRFSRITTLNAGYSYSNDCEFMKIIDIECCSRNKYESDFRSNENYLSSSENKLWKK